MQNAIFFMKIITLLAHVNHMSIDNKDNLSYEYFPNIFCGYSIILLEANYKND